MKHVIHQFCLTIGLFIAHSVGHQNVPPGVHPSHYQQQQVPIQQHHIPVQHMPVQQQHVPSQQQHVPVQQQHVPVQQQVPMQQVPVQQGVPVQHHQAHHHDGPPQVLNVANIAQEKQHIQEHLSVPIDTSKMTEQELQFHYFKMHDADNNNKLDGCELIKSLIHWHEQGQAEQGKPPGGGDKLFKDEELVSLIDPILALDDANNDGYIDYPEFVKAQEKASVAAQQQQQQHQQPPRR